MYKEGPKKKKKREKGGKRKTLIFFPLNPPRTCWKLSWVLMR
jgi:hypothetical protein